MRHGGERKSGVINQEGSEREKDHLHGDKSNTLKSDMENELLME